MTSTAAAEAVRPLVDRILVWQETKAAAQLIASSVPTSEKILPAIAARYSLIRRYASTDIEIKDVECINEGLRLKEEEGMNPVVLNLSDDREAGGCVGLGSGAQEESLWRRTALCVTQLQSFYPLRRSAIYSPDVPVLRASEQEFYQWYPTSKKMSFLACPAIRFPQWIYTPEEPEGDLSVENRIELAERLRLILQTAAGKGHDAVVLGAMGCGAWGNPPRAVAKVFAQVLPEFKCVFKKIVIAILNTNHTSGKTIRAFQKVFDEMLGVGGSEVVSEESTSGIESSIEVTIVKEE